MVDTFLRSEELSQKAIRLSELSLDPDKGLHRPFDRVDYQTELDETKFQFPEKLLSLYYHPIYKKLSHKQKWELSRLETINFFSINIHGERKLIQGLEDRLYISSKIGGDWSVGNYLQHFIHEENAHSHMLAGYCYRYGNGVQKDLSMQVNDPKFSQEGEELLFFGRVYVFETFLDYLNSTAMRDESIDVTARSIHRFHHMEEARHMAFDREVVKCCVNKIQQNGLHKELDEIAALLASYNRASLNSLYVPKIYREVGISNPSQVARETKQVDRRREIEEDWISTSEKFLKSLNLINKQE